MHNEKSAAIEKLLDQEFARSERHPLHGIAGVGFSLLSGIDGVMAEVANAIRQGVRAGSVAARQASDAIDRGLVAMGTSEAATHWQWPRSREA